MFLSCFHQKKTLLGYSSSSTEQFATSPQSLHEVERLETTLVNSFDKEDILKVSKEAESPSPTHAAYQVQLVTTQLKLKWKI